MRSDLFYSIFLQIIEKYCIITICFRQKPILWCPGRSSHVLHITIWDTYFETVVRKPLTKALTLRGIVILKWPLDCVRNPRQYKNVEEWWMLITCFIIWKFFILDRFPHSINKSFHGTTYFHTHRSKEVCEMNNNIKPKITACCAQKEFLINIFHYPPNILAVKTFRKR